MPIRIQSVSIIEFFSAHGANNRILVSFSYEHDYAEETEPDVAFAAVVKAAADRLPASVTWS